MEVTRNILLNPGPATTTDAVKFAQVVPDICPREHEFGVMVDWIQRELVRIAGSSEHNVCVLMGGSGTAAVESVISSVIPEQGALLVINNGAYGARIAKMAKIYQIPTVEFESSNSHALDYDALQEFIESSKAELQQQGYTLTHMAAIHHETTSGLLNDISKLGAIFKMAGLSCIIDAMSSYGVMDIDMDKDTIDYVISSSNKNIQGMAGIGIVIANKKALQASKDIKMRNLYLNLYDQYAYFCKTRQFRFTPPVQTMYALKRAVEEALEEGITARYNRYIASYRKLRRGMEGLGFTVLVADEISSGLITTFFEPKDENYSFDAMHDFLYTKGFTIYPGKVSLARTFRIANIGAIDEHDITDFLSAMEQYLTENSITVRIPKERLE